MVPVIPEVAPNAKALNVNRVALLYIIESLLSGVINEETIKFNLPKSFSWSLASCALPLPPNIGFFSNPVNDIAIPVCNRKECYTY